ncbi:hypothetical protein FHR90_000413 [Endobacter medicaginis]|uniref:Uncharacterized protein n=1 Tax=Endobacter medicaginis TaxID=1181271 RepID=A0A839UZ93_9PROT|nr:hypothetical protein [Endobacter medicaginis]MBB3172599.1 hypothetical protein [Endobacter medicaginis]MCX5476866.1 hypothetical protein [Endobacter medicaginis]NVN29377.1 hypothetical protein [Endobacter medicaginis]
MTHHDFDFPTPDRDLVARCARAAAAAFVARHHGFSVPVVSTDTSVRSQMPVVGQPSRIMKLVLPLTEVALAGVIGELMARRQDADDMDAVEAALDEMRNLDDVAAAAYLISNIARVSMPAARRFADEVLENGRHHVPRATVLGLYEQLYASAWSVLRDNGDVIEDVAAELYGAAGHELTWLEFEAICDSAGAALHPVTRFRNELNRFRTDTGIPPTTVSRAALGHKSSLAGLKRGAVSIRNIERCQTWMRRYRAGEVHVPPVQGAVQLQYAD